jgi:putative glutathione S-transferase
VRKRSGHRDAVTVEGGTKYPAEAGRYHLYIANNCPWSHRTALARSLKCLEDVVSMDVLLYRRDPEHGWQFCETEPGCTPDTVNGSRYLREIYEGVGSNEKSVPVLWDRKTGTIVSNESAEIIRMFDRAFAVLTTSEFELYPDDLAAQIDRLNVFTYHAINNGAYKAGFAAGQEAYEAAYHTFFRALELIDQMLRGRRFLLGARLTEADVRLFPTIFRFDAVYYTRFNLNERMVRDIPSLHRWLQAMLDIPAVRRASNLDHCRKGYFGRSGNNIVPLGPRSAGLDLSTSAD